MFLYWLHAQQPQKLWYYLRRRGPRPPVLGERFGWRFEPWGPPDSYLIHTGHEQDPGARGLMHKRREPVNGTGMKGFECTVGVSDIDETIRAIE